MNYVVSSQRLRWTFTQDQLEQSRLEARTDALLSTSEEAPLTAEEERELLRYYEQSVVNFCRTQNYSLNSVLHQDPSKLFVACIYVAAKVEEEYVSIDALVPLLPNLSEYVLRKSELRLLKAMDYDLIVHSPFRDIDGLIEDLSIHLKEGNGEWTGLGSLEELAVVRKSACVAAQCLMETDAPLLHSPDKLALAAVRSGFKRGNKRLDAYLHHVILPLLDTDGEALRQELSEIDRRGVEGSQRSAAETQRVQSIDRQLKTWLKGKNPKAKESRSASNKTEASSRHHDS